MKNVRTLCLALSWGVATLMGAQTTLRFEVLGQETYLFPLSDFNANQPVKFYNTDNGYTMTQEFLLNRKGETVSHFWTFAPESVVYRFDDTPIEKHVIDVDFDRMQLPVTVDGQLMSTHVVSFSPGHYFRVQGSGDENVEVTYRLRGTLKGHVYLNGNYKTRIELHGVHVTSSGEEPALWVDNGKRIDIVAMPGTVNTFEDSPKNLKKAAIFVKGHAELKGSGTINVTGNAKHAYASNEYTWIHKSFGTMNVLAAKGDGVHISQYLQMDGGTLNIAGTAGDAIDVEYTYDDEANTVIKEADEHNGQVIINAGQITAVVDAHETKALSCDGDMTINGGTLNLTLNGDGTRGLSVGSSSKNYISNLIIKQALPEVPTTINISGRGGISVNDEKTRALRVTGTFTRTGGTFQVNLPNGSSDKIGK